MIVRAAGIFIINSEDKLLICHPTNHAPDFWSIPKGKIEDGEDNIEAAIRETFEETNIDLTDNRMMKYLPKVNYKHKKKCLYPFVYHEDLNRGFNLSSIEIKCNSNVPEDRGGFPEMDDYKWVTLEEARKVLHESQVRCLEGVQELIDNKYNLIKEIYE